MRDDIDDAFLVIQAKLKEKNRLLEKFESIELKIGEILKNNKEDDISILTSDQSDILELINVIEYHIASRKDYIKNQTGRDFKLLIDAGSATFKDIDAKINELIFKSAEVIERISALKKLNMNMLAEQAEDLSRQVRELEIMNRITIITPKDL